MAKCIYCNSLDINKSDIIPKFMSRKSITRKFTCVKHNSYVGKHYEDIIASKTAIMRTILCIPSRTGNKQIGFKAKIKIGDEDIIMDNYTGYADVCWNRSTGFNQNGEERKFGIFSNNTNNVTNANSAQIELLGVNDCVDALFSVEMYKLVSKICYEYYCKINNINEYDCTKFSRIVKYIVDKDSVDKTIVNLVDDDSINRMCDENVELGSNTIFFYTEKDGTTFGVFRLWDLATYRVELCKSKILRFSSSIEELKSYMYDGKENQITISRLSCFNGVKLSVNEKQLRAKSYDKIKQILEAKLLTKNASRLIYNKIKKALNNSERSDDEKKAYLINGDMGINELCYVILKLYDNKEKYNFQENYNNNIRNIFAVSYDKLFISKEAYSNLIALHNDNFLEDLKNAIQFYDIIVEEK